MTEQVRRCVGKLFKARWHHSVEMKIRLPNGREVEAEQVDFEVVREDWNEYKLEDGTVLKFKAIVTDIIRTEEYDPSTGNPIYHVRSTNILRVKVPEHLRRLPSKRKNEGVEVG